jgi:hypothetical protein
MARWRTHNNRRKPHWRLDERGNYGLYARTRGWLWRDLEAPDYRAASRENEHDR